MNINNIINRVLLRYPLFNATVLGTKFTNDNSSVPAISYTDGKSIYYKNALFDQSINDQDFIISHEILHIELHHLLRNHGKDPYVLNYVEDGIINQLLKKDGLEIPEGAVVIEDALDYSVDELYLKYYPYKDDIKKFMDQNTYHISKSLDDNNNDNENEDSDDSEDDNDLKEKENYNDDDINKIFEKNKELRDKLLEELNNDLNSKMSSGNKETEAVEENVNFTGRKCASFDWIEILRNEYEQEKGKTRYYEMHGDGIIKKVMREDDDNEILDTEILIDSSGSMQIELIKTILRECKNIEELGNIKIGFFDTRFYGWHNINSNKDIDNLKLVGRGENDFYEMVETFSGSADNELIITDGYSEFPPDTGDVMWIVINENKPDFYECLGNSNAKYIYIDENEFIGNTSIR